jgi:hypothetical protein
MISNLIHIHQYNLSETILEVVRCFSRVINQYLISHLASVVLMISLVPRESPCPRKGKVSVDSTLPQSLTLTIYSKVLIFQCTDALLPNKIL